MNRGKETLPKRREWMSLITQFGFVPIQKLNQTRSRCKLYLWSQKRFGCVFVCVCFVIQGGSDRSLMYWCYSTRWVFPQTNSMFFSLRWNFCFKFLLNIFLQSWFDLGIICYVAKFPFSILAWGVVRESQDDDKLGLNPQYVWRQMLRESGKGGSREKLSWVNLTWGEATGPPPGADPVISSLVSHSKWFSSCFHLQISAAAPNLVISDIYNPPPTPKPLNQ